MMMRVTEQQAADAVLCGPDGVTAQGRGEDEPTVLIDLLAGKR
jgi:hypothetical protein